MIPGAAGRARGVKPLVESCSIGSPIFQGLTDRPYPHLRNFGAVNTVSEVLLLALAKELYAGPSEQSLGSFVKLAQPKP